jgi:hypothetical protein
MLLRHHNNDASNSLDVSRIDDERKQVEDMKQDMQALQAMVVAQTAQLAMDTQVVVCYVCVRKILKPGGWLFGVIVWFDCTFD